MHLKYIRCKTFSLCCQNQSKSVKFFMGMKKIMKFIILLLVSKLHSFNKVFKIQKEHPSYSCPYNKFSPLFASGRWYIAFP